MISKELKNYRNSYKFYIPYDYMLDEGIVFNKNNGFQVTFKVKYHDLDYVDRNKYINVIEKFNNAIKRLPDGFTLHCEIQRQLSDEYPSKNLVEAPIPTQIIETIRKNSVKNQNFYVTEYFITLTYLIKPELNDNFEKFYNSIAKKMFPSKIKTVEKSMLELKKEFDKELKFFKDGVEIFVAQYQESVLNIEQLKGEELLGYLYSTINLEKKKKIKVPKNNEILLDDYLTVSNLSNNGEITKINNDYLKVITINIFPDNIIPRIFNDIERLNFEYRMTTRFIMLTREETLKIIENYNRYYTVKLKKGIQYLLDAIRNSETMNIDTNMAQNLNQTNTIKHELKEGNIAYGYYTFNIILKDSNLERLDFKIQEIKKILTLYDFTAGEDKYNTLDSLFGSLPGNVVSNIRKMPISTYHLSALLPMSSIFEGTSYNNHLKDICLFTTKTENGLYYFNLHNYDIGHTSVIGPTGAGKSFLLGMIASEFLKYNYKQLDGTTKKAQVFFFDKDASSKVLTNLCGGKFFDLGKEKLAFQPLRNIDSPKEKEFALSWISLILEQEGIKVDAKVRNIIWEALKSLSDVDKQYRTIENFRAYIQSIEISQALSIYSGNEAYAKYFDSNEEKIDNNNFISFEMGEVIKNEKVITPLLDYIFHKIEIEKLDGTPSLIILDESWLFFKNPKMADKIAEWLKVLRKKNCSVIFATQSLSDVSNSSLFSTILDACKTQIFLPNDKAISTYIELYRKFNLNDIEISEIAEGTMKKDYFIKNSFGSRMISLNSTPTEIALLGSSEENDKEKIELIIEEATRKYQNSNNIIKYVNNEWIKYKVKINQIDVQDVREYYNILK